MQIDLFTLVAQIINFLILAVLLKYLLYDRIVKVMDERNEKITLQLKDVEQKKKEAEQEAGAYRQRLKELDDKREEMLSHIKEEVESQRKELLKKASDEVKETQAKWYEAIQREKRLFIDDLRRLAGKEVYAIARRVLSDLADVDLGRHMIDVFIKRIQQLDERERETLKESVQKSEYKVDICSAFEIPLDIRQKMVKEIQNQIANTVDVQFKISSDLICGIELKANGRKVAWNLEGYLNTLEDSLSNAFERKAKEDQDKIQEEKQERRRKGE